MPEKRIYALGFFDGVHLGHQALLRACQTLAREAGAAPGAITFDAHPRGLFSAQPPLLLNTTADRVELLKRYGMAFVEVLPVNRDVMSTPWRAFLENLLEKGAAGFVCGHDFRFGHRGEGDAQTLAAFCEERGLPFAVVPEQRLLGVRISSTAIREQLEAGELEKAVAFLGHGHVLSGTVIPGHQLGRTIGIPTANLALPQGLVCPKFGVYACAAWAAGQRYAAVTNVGTRPTVGGVHVTVEPWLLDFDGDLYGKTLTLEFRAFLRPEQKFDSLEALQQQIQVDAAQARDLL